MTTRAGNADAAVVTVKAVPRRKQVYKITYPNGKIYVGMEVQQRLFERPVLAHTGSPVADTAGVIGIIGAVSGVIFHSDQGGRTDQTGRAMPPES